MHNLLVLGGLRDSNLLLRVVSGIAQARIMAISDIVTQLVQGIKHGQDVDLNSIKREASGGSEVHSFASCGTIQN